MNAARPPVINPDDFFSLFWDHSDAHMRMSLCALATPSQPRMLAELSWVELVPEQHKAIGCGVMLLLDAHIHNRALEKKEIRCAQTSGGRVMEFKTAKEMVDGWDRGEIISTVQMGGIGPGYEQAIQVAVVEICRRCHDVKVSSEDEEYPRAFNEALDGVAHKLGLSGAQAGVAKWLAYQFCLHGHAGALKRARDQNVDSDRFIMVSNSWPRVSE